MAVKIDKKAVSLILERVVKAAPQKEAIVKLEKDRLDELIQEMIERLDDLLKQPPIIATDSATGCAACAACAICLADGPIPDAEPLGVVGLLGLAD